MNSKWLGLWAQERQGFYAGQVIKKSEIPKFTRIVLRYNKYYEKDGNRPRFVYMFADSEGYESKCVPIEYQEKDYTFTEEELQNLINHIACVIGGDKEYGEWFISDFIWEGARR